MHSTEHIRLMLNQACWTRLAIVNMSHRNHVWTLESFFAPNQSQSELEKNDTEDQCINQEEMDEDQRELKKSRDHKWLRYEKEAMCTAPEMIPNPEMIPKSTPKWSPFLFTSTLKWSPYFNFRNGKISYRTMDRAKCTT